MRRRTVKTFSNNLIAVLTVSAAVLAASSATAGGFSFGGGGGGGKGGKNSGNKSFKFNVYTGNFNHHNNHYKKKYYDCYDGLYRVHYIQPVVVYRTNYYPQFRACYVFPGDTWFSISKRCYGVEFLGKHVASFNRLNMSTRLMPGHMLRLPVVNANGSLSVSNAPMPAPFAPQGVPFAAQAAPVEPTLPQVAIGSTLMLDGESLGTEKGIVRLQINGMTLPVEVIEWTGNAVKVQLPKADLSRAVKAELEVLRADGSLASNSAIELMPATTSVALGN
jgi:hypothetical protein